MKIIGANVFDPRLQGEYSNPVLQIKVDQPVFEQGDPVHYPSPPVSQEPIYRYIPCGPFFAVEYRTGRDEWSELGDLGGGNSGDIGEFNTLGILVEQLVAVQVSTPEDEVDLYMTVARARRVVRKYMHDFRWNIECDEQAALLGSLKWMVELRSPVCYGGAVPRKANCGNTPTHIIVYKGTHLNLCEDHLRDHQQRLANKRRRTANL